MSSAARVGIDFGTTNSLCAWMDGDRPAIIPNARGARFTPSVVASTARGEIIVGESARNQALVNPDNTVMGIKRLLGSADGLIMGGREFRVEELVAMILGSLRSDAARFLGREVAEAVVTAPAHFSDRERRALAEAAKLAGFASARIVNEPTAAAVARAWSAVGAREGRALVLVYDFGGGTFDATLLEQDGSDCTVLSSRGDGRLGGAELDGELRRAAAACFREKDGLDLEADRFLSQQLADAAERAKIELSERTEATIALAFASAGGRVVHPSFTIARGEFESMARPFVQRSLDIVDKVLSDASVSVRDLRSLVLSGGSSRIPLVRRMLAEKLGIEPEGGINPEEIVAAGAAVWSSLFPAGRAGSAASGVSSGGASPSEPAFGAERLRVKDVVSRSYGVEADGGEFITLIRKNSPVPTARSRVFTTVSDGQDMVEIHVLQGESATAAENLSLGRFLLAGIPAAPAGRARVRVDFTIDESDMLTVAAIDLATGAQQAISIADLDRGASAESAEELALKIGLLVERLRSLRDGLEIERGLAAELEEMAARAGSIRSGQAREGELRLLKAELESLVGELLARRAENRPAPSRAYRGSGPARATGPMRPAGPPVGAR